MGRGCLPLTEEEIHRREGYDQNTSSNGEDETLINHNKRGRIGRAGRDALLLWAIKCNQTRITPDKQKCRRARLAGKGLCIPASHNRLTPWALSRVKNRLHPGNAANRQACPQLLFSSWKRPRFRHPQAFSEVLHAVLQDDPLDAVACNRLQRPHARKL
jgi:hypothetical protein